MVLCPWPVSHMLCGNMRLEELCMPSILLRLFIGISLMAVLGVCSAQADDAAHFQAMSLVRFAEAVELPPLSLPDLTGKEVQFRSFRGKVLLLNFWTTW